MKTFREYYHETNVPNKALKNKKSVILDKQTFDEGLFTSTFGDDDATTGSAVDLSATCEIVISRKFRGDILVIPNSSITRSGVGNNQFSFSSAGATLIPGTHSWALRRVSDNFVYSYGDWIVKQVATKD